jgi:hypothetical protein
VELNSDPSQNATDVKRFTFSLVALRSCWSLENTRAG